LAAQLQDHSLYRYYEAVCVGGLKEDSGTVDAPIGRHPVDRKKMAVDRKNGREAVPHWEVLGRYSGYTHIGCRLETGRTHQIRVHMAHMGHPLAGDFLYGTEDSDLIPRPALHSHRLTFLQPFTGERLTFTSPLPQDMERLIHPTRRDTIC